MSINVIAEKVSSGFKQNHEDHKAISKIVDQNINRISRLEKFMWAFGGALAVLSLIGGSDALKSIILN